MNASSDRALQENDTSPLRLLPPRAVSGSISRERLVSRVLRAGAPLILIQGPAGHGKSTLMQQVYAECEARQVRAGWLTLHESDNDLTRLISVFQALLGKLTRGASAVPLRSAATASSGGRRTTRTDWVVRRLLSLNCPVTLFIDEFQALSRAETLAFFHDLIAGLPQHVRIVIGSRTLPEIGLSRLIISERAHIIRAADLLFSAAEVERFFAGVGIGLAKREIEVIYDRTAGWPAAIQLYRLSLSNAEVRKSLGDINSFQPRQLTEYLTDNVLSIHPHETQRFFLETSLLVRMSGPLCDAVTGRHDSRELLAKLEESGLFVRSLDSAREWFQYHSLFSGFLREQLHRVAPAREPQIHAQTARWFADHGDLENALWHAVAVEDYAFAATCLDTWSTQLVMHGNLATIETWFDRLPIVEVQRHPTLLVKVAWALAFMRRQRKLDTVLELMSAQDGLESASSVVRSMVCILTDDIPGAHQYSAISRARGAPAGDPFAAFEAGSTAILEGHYAQIAGDLGLAQDLLLQGRACGKQSNSAFTVLGSIATAAVAMMMQGRLDEALVLLAEGPADDCMTLDQSVASAAYAASYIQALYESNQLGAAQQLFDESFEVIAGAAQVDFLAIAGIAMVRVYDLQGNAGRANALLDEIESLGHIGALPRLVRLVMWSGPVGRSSTTSASERRRSPAGSRAIAERCRRAGFHSRRIPKARTSGAFASRCTSAASRLSIDGCRRRCPRPRHTGGCAAGSSSCCSMRWHGISMARRRQLTSACASRSGWPDAVGTSASFSTRAGSLRNCSPRCISITPRTWHGRTARCRMRSRTIRRTCGRLWLRLARSANRRPCPRTLPATVRHCQNEKPRYSSC
jgi:LuxR family maltose regulon positive regulatory protein